MPRSRDEAAWLALVQVTGREGLLGGFQSACAALGVSHRPHIMVGLG